MLVLPLPMPPEITTFMRVCTIVPDTAATSAGIAPTSIR
jgi:hypothetical protein